MKRIVHLFVFFLFFLPVVHGSAAFDQKVKNLLIIIDSSASMSTKTEDGIQKLYAAKIALYSLVNELSRNLNVGLMTYGDFDTNPCDRVVVMVPVAPLNREALWKVTSLIQPKGLTPLANSLEQGAHYLSGIEGRALIMLITDGQDTCAGDPVAIAARIEKKHGIEVKVNVIGLGVPREEERQLKDIARAGGGDYYLVNTQQDLINVTSEIAGDNLDILTGEEGTLIINFGNASSSVIKLAIYNQDTQREVTGGSIWKSFRDSFTTRLRPGRYRVEFQERDKKFPTVIYDVVIDVDKETAVNLEDELKTKKRRKKRRRE
jgi:hypothetical protein